MTAHTSKVLFLSTGDATRSLIAEGFLRSLSGERFDVVSAGVDPGASNPLTSEVMKEARIDISGQKPKSIAYSLKQRFGHVIAICDTSKERSPIFPFALSLLHWSVVDPNSEAGLPSQKTEAFREMKSKTRSKQFLAETGEMKVSELSIA